MVTWDLMMTLRLKRNIVLSHPLKGSLWYVGGAVDVSELEASVLAVGLRAAPEAPGGGGGGATLCPATPNEAAGGRRSTPPASCENDEGVLCHGATGVGAVALAGEGRLLLELKWDDGAEAVVEGSPRGGAPEVVDTCDRPRVDGDAAEAALVCIVRGSPIAGEDEEAYCLGLETLATAGEGADGGNVASNMETG